MFKYINAVLAMAQFVELQNGSVYGEVSEIPGIECTGKTMQECKHGLREMIKEWVKGTLRTGDILPVINGIDLNKEKVV